MGLLRLLGPLALSFAGLLTGNELGTLVVIHPRWPGCPGPHICLPSRA